MKTLKNQNSKAVAIFLVITLALSGIFYFLIINSGTMTLYHSFGLMWCPGISALITMKLLKRNLRELGWKWGKTKYQIWSYTFPMLYVAIAYLIIWGFGWGEFYDKEFVKKISDTIGLSAIEDGYVIALYVFVWGIVGLIPNALFALGEEIGWRGFLVPELYRTQAFTRTSLISGFIWAIWHFPIILFSQYDNGMPSWFALPCFVVMIVSISFIFTWYRIKSGSLWTAVILHAAHNLYIQNIFTPLTQDTGNTAYFIDEFGIVIPIITMGFAFYFWTKRKELKPVPNMC